MTSPINAMFARLVGHQIEGGCDDCDAYQEVRQEFPGMWIMTVHHDDWCPTLARYEQKP